MPPGDRSCLICAALEADPSEEQLHRLVRFYERKVGELSDRLLSEGDRRSYENRVAELERTIARLNDRLSRRTA